MRKCVRCNIAMVENCGIKVKGAACGGAGEWSSLK